MTNKYFTSDWHFGHESILKGIRGKFFSSVEEHDAIIKENIFKTVKPGGDLYFLGDAFWKYSSKQVEQFMTDLKKHRVNLHWILGNHDKLSWTKFSCIKWVGQIEDIVVEKHPITLAHYPMRVWNKSHFNAWQLYGHIHYLDHTDRNCNYELLGKQLNMNVEFWNYNPVSFPILKATMSQLKDNWDLIKK